MAETKASHLARMITAEELSDQLGGQLTAHALRKRARLGLVPGSVRIGRRVLFDSRTAGWLVQDLAYLPPKAWGLNGPV